MKRISVIVFETERLVLRRLDTTHASFILRLLYEPAFVRYVADRGVRTTMDACRYIMSGPVASYKRNGFGLFCVELKENGEPVGICGLIKRDTLEDVDLGYALLQRHWGKGYAREAAVATLEYGRREHGLKRIVALTSPDNEASIRLLNKIGFRYDRMIRLTESASESRFFIYDPVEAGIDESPGDR